MKNRDIEIIKTIEQIGFYNIKRTNSKDIEEINKMGIHRISTDTIIIYDRGTLTHYLETKNLPNKTARLSPSQTEIVVKNPDEVLPNFIRGTQNSYLYIKKLINNFISIVEVLDRGRNLRITHGGFEIKNERYLRKERELKKSILEGRHSFIGQSKPKLHD